MAGKMRADKVIFLTDVAGLLIDGRLVEDLTIDEAKRMLPKIGFGMEKKILACTEALELRRWRGHSRQWFKRKPYIQIISS